MPSIQFRCQSCEKPVEIEAGRGVCRFCQKVYSLELPQLVKECVICHGSDFYIQRDFNRRMGIFIVVIGALLAVPTRGVSLIACVFLDVILYKVLPIVSICYHCQTIYRDFPKNTDHQGYDHKLGEKYRSKRERE